MAVGPRASVWGIARGHGTGGLMTRMSPGVLAPPHELLTPDEWRRRGREMREDVPRESHAQWEPPADRPDPVDILEEQARTRVPDLVPIRYGRMIASPFAYFRGAAAPMAWDLAHTPTTGAWSSTSTTSTRPCRPRSSGISSGWRPASPSPPASGSSATRTPTTRP